MIGLDTNVLVRYIMQDDAAQSVKAGALMDSLTAQSPVVERAEIVWKAMRHYRDSKADFADCLIELSNASAGCEYTATFDQGAAKHASMSLIQ